MILKRAFTSFFVLISVLAMGVLAQKSAPVPPIKYKEYSLANGLRVVMHPDKSTPIVAVNLWYHVGSKNEAPGKTGFAHLFEHMMFQGSKNYEAGYVPPLNDAGGTINGTTDRDRTFYYEVVPSNFLELALYLEADRMGNLLEAMSQEKLDNQRDVVKNERRQRVDNVPGGNVSEKTDAIMYPAGHPYHHPVIGSMADLSAASLEDVKTFFRQYYVPNNAVLVLAGDFDEKQARTWIEKYFGGIAKGADINRPNPPPLTPLKGEIRKTYENAVPLPRLSLFWHGIPQFSREEYALDILANILSAGRGSRLQSNLTYGKELAQNIFAYNGTEEIAGFFQIQATARPGKTLEEIEREINFEIERLKKEPPTAEEMNRALNAVESSNIFQLQTVLGKGEQLASSKGFTGKPDYFQTSLDRHRKVTPADVQRAANKYLTGNRLVVSLVPGKNNAPKTTADGDVNKPTSTSEKKKDEAKIARQMAMLPKPGANPKLNLPPIEKTRLSNGLEVWVVRQTELPIVSMNLVVKSGAALDSADKSGVASMTAGMLNRGTPSHTAVEIANQLQSIGASIDSSAGWDSANVSMQSLTKNLDQALAIYSDVIVNPAFPASELESSRRRILSALLQRRANSTLISMSVHNKVLYGDQPYGRHLLGDEKSIKAIAREDLVSLYNDNYRPNNSTLIVVGDVDVKTLMPKLEKAFANWKPGNVEATPVLKTEMKGKPGVYIVDKPGAAQSSIYIGQVGISRDNPDYYAAQVMNSILGGGASARLFMNLREAKGYTYGAYSRFDTRRGAGPFSASAEVQTGSTKESVVEFIKELNGIRGAIPITKQELENNKQALIRRYPAGFETVGQISSRLSSLVVYNLPDSYFNDYISKINAVTQEDVNRAANKYLTPKKMAIVIVGDRKAIEFGIKELGYAVTILNLEGDPAEN